MLNENMKYNYIFRSNLEVEGFGFGRVRPVDGEGGRDDSVAADLTHQVVVVDRPPTISSADN